MIWLSVAAVAVGFTLLMWGADRFVFGAAAIARNLGISPLIIGLTIVGLGTSAPEMLVSAAAAWNGTPHLGVGNALGSNIANVGLVIGLTALITPLAVRSETLRREFPLLLAIMLIALALLIDGELSRLDGSLLLAGMALLLYWLVSLGRQGRADGATDPMDSEYEESIPRQVSTPKAVLWILLGLAVLLGSSELLVWGAVDIAQWLGVSELVIGLTIVAIGTSLPELAAAVVSALKNEHDIAIGNVLGSNMFNLLVVLGLPGIIAPHALPPEVLTRDYPLMIALTIGLFAMAYGFRRPGHVNRAEGAILLAAFCGYLAYLFLTSTG